MKKILIFIFSLINVYNFASAGDVNPLSLDASTYLPYKSGAPYSLVAHGTKNDNFRNTNQDPGTTWIISNLILSDLLSLDKFEMNGSDGSWSEENNDTLNNFNITTANGTRTGGTWEYLSGELNDDNTNNDFKLYFSIKAGNGNSDGGWNLFAMNDDWNKSQAVMWSTLNDFFTTDLDNLGDKNISHISFWRRASLPSNANHTPEPATLMLLGFGLMGLAGMGRRTIEK